MFIEKPNKKSGGLVGGTPRKELIRNKSNPKFFLRILQKDILPINKTQSLNLIDTETNSSFDQKEIPPKINEFFTGIGPSLADSFPDSENLPVRNVHDEPVEFFEIRETNLAIVVRYIKELSVYKSSGIGDLGSRLLKDVFL